MHDALPAPFSCEDIIVPRENLKEAAVVNSISVIPARSLPQIVEFLRGNRPIRPQPVDL